MTDPMSIPIQPTTKEHLAEISRAVVGFYTGIPFPDPNGMALSGEPGKIGYARVFPRQMLQEQLGAVPDSFAAVTLKVLVGVSTKGTLTEAWHFRSWELMAPTNPQKVLVDLSNLISYYLPDKIQERDQPTLNQGGLNGTVSESRVQKA